MPVTLLAMVISVGDRYSKSRCCQSKLKVLIPPLVATNYPPRISTTRYEITTDLFHPNIGVYREIWLATRLMTNCTVKYLY